MPTAATRQCHVLLMRMGRFWGGLVAGAVGLTLFSSGWASWGYFDALWCVSQLLVGLLLFGGGLALVRQASAPMLAVLTDDMLRLEPRGRSLGYGHAALVYPLGDIAGYNLMASPNGAQVTVETSGGTTQQLWPRFAWALRTAAERAADAALPGVVDLDTFGAELLRRMELHQAALRALTTADAPQPVLERPGFFQGKLARALSWLFYAVLAAAVVLLFVPSVELDVCLEMLGAAVVYLGIYWRNQDVPAAAAPEE